LSKTFSTNHACKKKNEKNENKKIIKKKDYPKNKLETTHFKKIIQKYKTSKKKKSMQKYVNWQLVKL
jgi:hypothetical protein